MTRKKQFNKDSTSWIVLSIGITFLSVIPLLVRITSIQYPMAQFDWYHSETQFYDIYNYFKSNLIILIGFLSLITLVIRQYKQKILNYKDPVFIITVSLGVLIFLSYLLSVNSYVSSRGYITRHESVWVWLSYISTFLLLYSFNWTKKHLNIIAKSFIAANALLSIIGIFQYFGLDLVLNDFTRPFITAFNMTGLDFSTVYSLNYTVIIQTLFHYNYVAFFITLSLPFALTLILYEESTRMKFFYGALSIMILFNLLGSGARAGLLGIVVSVPFFIFLNRKFLFKRLSYAIGFVILILVLVTGFEVYSGGFLSRRILSTFTSVEAPNILKSITIQDDNEIDILIHDSTFKIEISNHSSEVWDLEYYIDGDSIKPVGVNDENKLYFEHPSLSKVFIYMVKFSEDGDSLLGVEIMNSKWRFDFTDEGLKLYNPYGYYTDIETPKSIGFENRERLGSSRGYIWSRTLPLIINKPILGYGPDTFALVFPQHDYVGKYNAYNTTNMIVDKAHNLYLQIAINSGLPALALYLLSILLYLIRSIKLLVRNNWQFENFWISTVFISLIAYSVSSLFNDSTVSISPTYWALLAIGYNQLNLTAKTN